MKTHHRLSALLLHIITTCVLLCSNLHAKIEGKTLCKFRREDGWSKPYNFNVNVISGMELMLIDPLLSVDSSKVYVEIWFSPNEVALVAVNELLGTIKFDETAIRQAEMYAKLNDPLNPYLQGVDQRGKEWRVFFPIQSKLTDTSGENTSIEKLLSNRSVYVISPTTDIKNEAAVILDKSAAKLVKPKYADYIVALMRSSLENPITFTPKSYNDLEDQARLQSNLSAPILHVYVFILTDFLELRPVGHWRKKMPE